MAKNDEDENKAIMVKPTSQNKQMVVRSNTELKYSLVEAIPKFAQLRLDTDLKISPENWLLSNVRAGRQSLPAWCLLNPRKVRHEFSSGRLASSFIDLLENVDVVADAEHIKSILKMPFGSEALSMVVHRVGKTMLLDEFDVHKHLTRASGAAWEVWWRKFYAACVAKNSSNVLPRRDRTREALENRNLLSKFLYRSIASDEPAVVEPTAVHDDYDPSGFAGSTVDAGDCDDGSLFSRSLLWTFEDIRMLIGSNMPIFGGGTHPVVSLRLHDMRQPITVLTGLDYWLDNLMCNVPEVVMCYHLEGIVRKYEFFKTEELPRVEGSQFSPLVVKDVARNILSFLKSNATQPGHTYWLFKGKNDDFVKLYDLTSLSRADEEAMKTNKEEASSSKGGTKKKSKSTCDVPDEKTVAKMNNPYTVPVALLLYRVAKNMLTNDELHGGGGQCRISRKKASTIGTLLSNCVHLLDEKDHPGVFSASYFMLANLCLADLRNLNALNSDDEGTETDTETEGYDDDRSPTPSTDGDVLDEADSASDGQEGKTQLIPGPSVAPPTTLSSVPMSMLRDPAVKFSNTPTQNDTFQVPEDEESRALMCLKFLDEALRVLGGPLDLGPKWSGPPSTAIPLFWTPLGTSKSIVQVFNAPSSASKRASSLGPTSSAGSSSCGRASFSSNSPSPPPSPTPPVRTPPPWKSDLGLLAWRKAATACLALADHYIQNVTKLGLALKYADAVLLCREEAARLAKEWENDTSLDKDLLMIETLAFAFAGDAYFLMTTNWKSEYESEFRDSDAVAKLRAFLRNPEMRPGSRLELPALPKSKGKDSYVFAFHSSLEDRLKAGFLAYDKAARGTHTNEHLKNRILRRLAASGNELGAFLINKAPYCGENDEWKTLLKDADRYLHRSYQVFESVGDMANMAIVAANLGRMLRTRARFVQVEAEKKEGVSWGKVVLKLRNLLDESIGWYKKALSYIEKPASGNAELTKKATKKSRQRAPPRRMPMCVGDQEAKGLIEGFRWELSTTYFTLATVLQDFAPGKGSNSIETLAREEDDVASLLNVALKITESLAELKCGGDGRDTGRLVLYQFRIAMIHHRLGTLWHYGLKKRVSAGFGRPRNEVIPTLEKAERHMLIAANAFLSAERMVEYLRESVSLSALFDNLLDCNLVQYNQRTCLALSVLYLLKTRRAFEVIAAASDEELPVPEDTFPDLVAIMKVFIQALRAGVLAMMKVGVHMDVPSNNATMQTLYEQEKEAYRLALQAPDPTKTEYSKLKKFATTFAESLRKIDEKLVLKNIIQRPAKHLDGLIV